MITKELKKTVFRIDQDFVKLILVQSIFSWDRLLGCLLQKWLRLNTIVCMAIKLNILMSVRIDKVLVKD